MNNILWAVRDALSDAIRRPIRLMALILFAVMCGSAMADGPMTTTDILGATGPTDKATAVFYNVLGDFFLHPLASFGGTSTLLGNLFVIFNAFVFMIGALWASYGLLSGIVETANSGEALGKRLSTVWLPIRMVTGIVGIAPIFAGYSLAQVFIVSLAGLGIGVANMMWTGAITDAANFMTLIPPSAAMAAASPSGVESAAMGIFRAHVCMDAQQHLDGQTNSIDNNSASFVSTAAAGASNIWFAARWGSPTNPAACGSATLRGISIRSASSATGFRVSSVDYTQFNALAQTVQGDSAAAFARMVETVKTIAQTWYTGYLQSTTTTGTQAPIPAYPQAAIDAAAAAYKAAVIASLQSAVALQSGTNATLKTRTIETMKKDGFFGAGAWFSTFGEANAAMADVMKSVSIEVAGPTEAARYSPSIADTLKSIENAQNRTAAVNVGGVQGIVTDTDQYATIKTSLCQNLNISMSSTNNCSIGQAIVEKGIQAAAMGSGGGGTGFFDDVGLINPIVMMKNMGDYSMTIAESIYAMMTLADTVGLGDDGGGAGKVGVLSSVASGAASLAGKTGVGAVLIGAVKGSMKMLSFVAGPLLLVGLVMSIYIPMIPFITWMGGLIQYCVIVLQGLVGAPIAALSHLDAEGEGLGRRTEAGYMFALNVLFRPALMLFGFFLASAVMIGLGSFQANLFMMAMGNAQGNSITGLMSIAGYLIIFFVLNVTLIQGLFNMIFLLPDQILSLVGSGGHMADLGKEVESKVHGLFLSGARTPQSLTRGLGSRAARSSAASGGAPKAKPTAP